MTLVSPLGDAWQPVLDAVLAELRAPRLADVARLAPRVQALSASYNAARAGDAAQRGPLPLEARVAFSFARDVPKGAGAVRELVATRALSIPDRPLRVLDLGAGLGAMTWGLARALAAAGATGRIEALLVDEDPRVLSAASSIARHARPRVDALGLGGVTLEVRTHAGRVGEAIPGPLADVVIFGQVLSEMDVDVAPEARVLRHADVLRNLLRGTVAEGGSLVVVEPALKDRTRHLHAIRDALLASAHAHVFAPCLHETTCPMLAAPGDWCHEDLAVDLPPFIAPLARAAGLRFQGLTFSYLVLRRDARALATALPSAPDGVRRLRVVSDRLVSKGKSEVWACTTSGERSRIRRLDRDASAANAAWDELGRGDVVTLAAAEDGREDRVGPGAGVDVWRARCQ